MPAFGKGQEFKKKKHAFKFINFIRDGSWPSQICLTRRNTFRPPVMCMCFESGWDIIKGERPLTGYFILHSSRALCFNAQGLVLQVSNWLLGEVSKTQPLYWLHGNHHELACKWTLSNELAEAGLLWHNNRQERGGRSGIVYLAPSRRESCRDDSLTPNVMGASHPVPKQKSPLASVSLWYLNTCIYPHFLQPLHGIT